VTITRTVPKDPPRASVISGISQGEAGRCRQRPVEWLNPPGPGLTSTRATQADRHPNIVVQGEAVDTVPLQLLRWWASAGHECVVIDMDGRYAQIDLPAPASGYVDLAEVPADQLGAVLRTRYGVSVLDFSHLPGASRSMSIGRALSVVAAHRALTGRLHWLMIDDAQMVLSDRDIPSPAINLCQRGYCLVMRSPERLPASFPATIDFIAGIEETNLQPPQWPPPPPVAGIGPSLIPRSSLRA
jgi:hypothetical protein